MSNRILALSSLFFLFFVSAASVISAQGIKGTYKIIVNGYDWGPSVNKVIVSLDSKISKVNPEDFTVTESKNWYPKGQGEGFSVSNFDRTVVDAYLSDDKGNKVKKASNFFTLELKVSPDEGSPFLYDFFVTQANKWANPYYLGIKLKEGKTLVYGKTKFEKLSIEKNYTEKMMPEADKFKKDKYTSEKITLSYAHYIPKKDNKKNPLVIWLHGMGEGGNDPDIALLGNKVVALASEETQKMLKNAYILVPQSPTFWMDNGSGDIGKFDGTSKYEAVLMNLIKNYVDTNPDIDKSKVIIGGCSNGGFMTLRMLFLNPDYFSAAYPICPPYTENLVTDEMIKTIKDIPMWFTFALNDNVVSPKLNEIPLLLKLSSVEAKDLRISVFSSVKDTSGLYKNKDGEAYEYNGHWSWIYTLNNEAVEKGLSLFEWAGNQTNPNVK